MPFPPPILPSNPSRVLNPQPSLPLKFVSPLSLIFYMYNIHYRIKTCLKNKSEALEEKL